MTFACPRDRSALTVEGERLVCEQGHEYPYVDGIPVLVVEDAEPTQPGYWARPEHGHDLARFLTQDSRGNSHDGRIARQLLTPSEAGTGGQSKDPYP